MTRPEHGGAPERGQAVAEFAVAGFLFFLLVLGTIEVGRAVWYYNTLAQAVREGTRYAIVHGNKSADPSGPGSASFMPPHTDSKVTDVVEKYASGLDKDALTVEAAWPDGTNDAGSPVQVTARYVYDPIFDLFGFVSFTMSSTSEMEITY